jgi:hypothetical protein
MITSSVVSGLENVHAPEHAEVEGRRAAACLTTSIVYVAAVERIGVAFAQPFTAWSPTAFPSPSR